MPARVLTILLFIELLAAGVAAQAAPERDSTRLDDLVVTAARAPTRLRALGSSADRLGERDLDMRQRFALRDALRLLPGSAVHLTGAPGGVTSVFLRGVSSTQTLVLVDGVRVNDANAEPSAFLGGADVVAGAVEVVRGPQSTLYGGAAIGGVIALGLPLATTTPALRAEAEGGSFGTWRGILRSGGRSGRVAFALGLTADGTDNERQPNGWDQRTQAARLELSAGGGVMVGGTFRGLQSSYTSPGDLRSSNPTPEGETTFENHLATAYVEVRPASGWTSRLLAGGQRQYTKGTGAFFGEPFRFSLSVHRSVLDWQNTVAAGRRVRIVAGANTEWSTVWSGDGGRDERLHAGYAQGELSPRENLTISAGLRHDDYDSFGSATTWRVTGAWLPGGATRLHGSYGTGFMPPSLSARYGSPFQNPNPAIRAERARGLDLGVERFLLGGRASLGLTWFRTTLRDLIGFQSAPFPALGMSVNIERARTQGLEASGRATVGRIDARAAWTLLSARSETTSDPELRRLIRRPRHTVTTDVAVHAGARGIVGAGLLLVADRRDSDFNQFPSVRVDPGDYQVVRVYGSLGVGRRMTLRGRIENLFDERYEEVYGFPALGRSLHAGVAVEW